MCVERPRAQELGWLQFELCKWNVVKGRPNVLGHFFAASKDVTAFKAAPDTFSAQTCMNILFPFCGFLSSR